MGYPECVTLIYKVEKKAYHLTCKIGIQISQFDASKFDADGRFVVYVVSSSISFFRSFLFIQ